MLFQAPAAGPDALELTRLNTYRNLFPPCLGRDACSDLFPRRLAPVGFVALSHEIQPLVQETLNTIWFNFMRLE